MWWFNWKQKHLPLASGPFVPGCVDIMLGYEKNGLFMRLYYPTDAKKDGSKNYKRWYPWIPDDSYIIGIANVLMSFTILVRLAFWWSGNILIPALYGAKPSTIKPLKCVIFSHGLGGHRFLYSNTCCELASRGFLVAALEHRDCSASNTFYYSSKADAQLKRRTIISHKHINLGKDHYKKRNSQVHYRSEECRKVLDFLQDVNRAEIPVNILEDVPTSRVVDFKLNDLQGRLDLEDVTMMGHSFGGATALLALSKIREFKQGILLDPWMFPIKNEGLENKVKQPLLFINTQTFHIASNVEAMEKFLEEGHGKMYTILHTTHENQTDSVLLVGYWLNWFMKKLDPKMALKINNALILRFLNRIIGFPTNVSDCIEILEEQRDNVDTGLTRPWA